MTEEVVPELKVIPDQKDERIYANIIRILQWANEHSHDDGTV